jgi:hypothetical protein
MVTKEQFMAYIAVRDSGVTNMFDTRAVTKYAKKLSDVTLERKDCLEIMANFSKLKHQYGDSVKPKEK